MPQAFADLNATQQKLEDYFHDMQDLEFTIQDGKLWMLQTRNGKRTGTAMVKMAVDMLNEGLIDEKTALLRMEPNKLDELLHPVFDKGAKAKAKVLTKVFRPLREQLADGSYSLPTRLKSGKPEENRSSWFVWRPLPKICGA